MCIFRVTHKTGCIYCLTKESRAWIFLKMEWLLPSSAFFMFQPCKLTKVNLWNTKRLPGQRGDHFHRSLWSLCEHRCRKGWFGPHLFSLKLISIDSARGLLPWSKSGQPGNALKSKIESREREQVTNDRCTLHEDVEVGQACFVVAWDMFST